jgi:uncharacterized damage-inducible protein DinB
MNTKDELFVKMVINSWLATQKSINKNIDRLSEEELNTPILPGKNTPAWIIGHLAAVNDNIATLLELGPKLKPEYEKALIHPDGTVKAPSTAEMIKYWHDSNAYVNEKIAALSTEDWFGKHTAVSAEDFAKEPHRNKLNVLMSRTNHLSHHLGQLVLAKNKVEA